MGSIEDAYRDNWEPWYTVMSRRFTLTDAEGMSMTSPFAAQAATYDDANRTMMVHIGVMLLRSGHHPAWLKED